MMVDRRTEIAHVHPQVTPWIELPTRLWALRHSNRVDSDFNLYIGGYSHNLTCGSEKMC